MSADAPPGPGLRRIRLAAAALLLCAGCAATAHSTGLPPDSSPDPSPSATRVDPVEQCADSVAYWVRYLVTPGNDQGFDYQEMGLSGGENDIVNALLPTARATVQRQGPSAAQADALAQARPRCRAYLAAASGSPAPGWPR
ncbi:hypothetical protein [Streptacidiphilus carbonis]|uniref:hypothetical protein n=1 Tax=Streptacidiphilus carbonis TaxID=105422 RepID=UPI0006934E2B|nr:hypothetical protein [Streptacidiphilus carbonis]